MLLSRLSILLCTLALTTPTFAARCGGDFNTFVAGVSADARAAGISPNVISSALGGVQQDGAVLAFDRRQRYTFNKSFEQYVSTRVGSGRINGGRAMMQRHAALLSRIEQQFGVPPQILVAIWGLETDFGKGDMGRLPVFRVLATLAHDCRRSELFQGELLAALKIVQRGDLRLNDMIGAYAGEIGQTQFLPSSYIKYGVDFDGDGHVDLRHSVPDVLASTANLLHTPAASAPARPTARAVRTSRRCASGTGPRSIARPSAISPTGWWGGDVSFVIPGRALARTSDAQLRIGESRDSGSGPSDHPGMTDGEIFPRHCERKRSNPFHGSAEAKLDCFVAIAPRNDDHPNDRHSGTRRLARARNPYSRWWLWIPGSCGACHRAALRADPLARPGMTMTP